MSVIVDLNPGTLQMQVIATTTEAVYLRLPLSLQRDCGGCTCPQCKLNPELAKWDTLVVPVNPIPGRDRSHTVHMPNGSVEAFLAYAARCGIGR